MLCIIAADLAAHPPAAPAPFVSRDAAAYASAAVRAELRRLGCDYLSGFRAAVGRIGATSLPP